LLISSLIDIIKLFSTLQSSTVLCLYYSKDLSLSFNGIVIQECKYEAGGGDLIYEHVSI